MSSSINIGRLIILGLFSLGCLWAVIKFTYTGIQKMYYIFSIVGIVIYSGISTTYNNLCDEYFFSYLIFHACYTAAMIFAIRIHLVIKKRRLLLVYRVKEYERSLYLKQSISSEKLISDRVLKVCVLLFFSYYFIQLIYPEFRLSDLFRIGLSIDDIFSRRSDLRGNLIYQLFYYVNLFTVAFLFIFAYRKYRQKKCAAVIILFLLWYYLQMVTLGYMSRNEMLIVIAFIVILFDNRKWAELKITPRLVITGLVIAILMLPFLNAYELLRMGISARRSDVWNALGELLEKETTYGRYYDFCASNSEEILILRYLVWFITLPLPSVIFGSIKEFGLSTNTYFTVLYTGVQEGASNYSVILPSIFGESLMIWGRNAYWVEALLVGFFVGKFCVCMERNEELSLLNVYFAVNMFIMGRGGSEAVIANMVNYMVMYLIIMKLIVKKKRRNVRHLAQ